MKTLTQINCFPVNSNPRLFKLYYQSSLETRTIRKPTRKAQPIMSWGTHTSKHWTWFKYLISSVHLHWQKIWRFSGKPLWDNMKPRRAGSESITTMHTMYIFVSPTNWLFYAKSKHTGNSMYTVTKVWHLYFCYDVWEMNVVTGLTGWAERKKNDFCNSVFLSRCCVTCMSRNIILNWTGWLSENKPEIFIWKDEQM